MSTSAAAFAGVPRVNLMPRSEVARRERDGLVRMWAWIMVAAIIVTLLVIAGAIAFKFVADQGLAAEEAQTNDLLVEIAALSEVSQALASESELTDFRANAMASDLAWSPALVKVTGVLPPDTTLTGFDFTVGGTPMSEDPTVEQGLVGTVTIDSATPLDIVAIIRSLRGVDGVLFADGQSVTSSQISGSRFSYLLNIELDQTLYSGNYSVAEEGQG